ncbi:uncharacterized protein IL334_006597 [Kwoniella shivajii]|uniref:Uncharacterized protein n=1 Tax=Kwoniella shivajii TaxID=564305 RepID=A0ABZ1D6D9_9TREE|nr:hypothetical protein IL334_006597 [Kwoniella shivajii]
MSKFLQRLSKTPSSTSATSTSSNSITEPYFLRNTRTIPSAPHYSLSVVSDLLYTLGYKKDVTKQKQEWLENAIYGITQEVLTKTHDKHSKSRNKSGHSIYDSQFIRTIKVTTDDFDKLKERKSHDYELNHFDAVQRYIAEVEKDFAEVEPVSMVREEHTMSTVYAPISIARSEGVNHTL